MAPPSKPPTPADLRDFGQREDNGGRASGKSIAKKLQIGQLIAERYVVLAMVGAGAMGQVFEAYDSRLERRVALKILSAVQAQGAPGQDTSVATLSLVSEAQALAKLSHPNIVSIYDVGSSARGTFIAMEYVHGSSLRQWLHAKPRSWREIVSVFIQAGHGLAHAHAAGLIHRDIKPDNLLISRQGEVKIADFGLAVAHHAVGHDDTLFVGTPGYMAPEQHRRESVTTRADIYAFCVSLYEALHGRRPYVGENHHEILAAIENRQRRPLPSKRRVPSWLIEAVERGLEAQASRRPPTIDELVATLQRGHQRSLVPALSLAGVVVLCLTAGWWSQERLSADERCESGWQLGGELWSENAYAGIEQAFLATGLPHARDTANTVGRMLEARALDLAQERRELCQQPPNVMVGKERDLATCLQDKAQEFRALVAHYEHASTSEVNQAATFVAAMEPVHACRSRGHVHAHGDDFVDPILAAKKRQAQRELRQWVNDNGAGVQSKQFDETVAELEPLLLEVGTPDLLAEFHRMQSVALTLDLDASAHHADVSALFADASRNDEISAQVSEHLAFHHGYRQQRSEAAQVIEMIHHARAHAQRNGDSLALAKFCLGTAPAQMNIGWHVQAEACLRAALDRFEAELGTSHPQTNRTRVVLAVTLLLLDRDAEAEFLLWRVYRELTFLNGEHHPSLSNVLYNLAVAAQRRSDFVLASELFGKLERNLVGVKGMEEFWLSAVINQGESALMIGRAQPALEAFERGIQLIAGNTSAGVLGPSISLRLGRLQALLELGHWSQACVPTTVLERDVASFTTTGIYGEDRRISGYLTLASLAFWCGELPRAKSFLAHAQATYTAYALSIADHEWLLWELSAQVALASGDHAAMQEALQRRASPRKNDGRGIGPLRERERRAQLLLALGQPEAALPLVASLPAAMSPYYGEASAALVRPFLLVARAHLQLGQPEQAQVALKQATERLQVSEDPLVVAELLALKAQHAHLVGWQANELQLRAQAKEHLAKLGARGLALQSLVFASADPF